MHSIFQLSKYIALSGLSHFEDFAIIFTHLTLGAPILLFIAFLPDFRAIISGKTFFP